MKVSFFSNYFNSHQLPLSLEFANVDGVEYTFISLMQSEGLVGRRCLDFDYPFVLREYEGGFAVNEAMQHAIEDDVVIFGDMAGKEQYVRERAGTGKMFFRYAERLLKRGDWWRYVPPKAYRTWNQFGRYRDANMRVLCASAYTARDLAMFGFPKNKCLKWGYFPDAKVYHERTWKNGMQKGLILGSAQRLIPLKRVDIQIKLAHRLKEDGYCFELKIAGDGPERDELERLKADLGLDDCVEFLGELDRDEVQRFMRESDVFLATSNRREGWGATVGEAMASGCCVVASDAMGSAPFLIKDGENGCLFHDGKTENLVEVVKTLFDKAKMIENFGRKAIETIDGEWGARTACRRLLACCEYGDIFSDGPISPCR